MRHVNQLHSRKPTAGARVGGRLVSGMQLDALFAAAAQRADQPRIDSISVGEDLHLVLPPGQLNYFVNHSCNSNPWWVDAYTLAARRPITAGEEVTSDCGTSTAVTGFSMSGTCGSPHCRTTVTGRDWQRADLQQRYGDHWIPLLLVRIRQSRPGEAARPQPWAVRARSNDQCCWAEAERPSLRRIPPIRAS